jgi:5-methyltetrahydrofolate--homocysteine methyltransferase
METTLSSKTKTVTISADKPFVIIGERINPTGRKKLAAELAAGDFSRVRADALAQVAAGAHVLDVNSGVPMVDESAIMRQAVQTVMDTVDVPLCFDSSMVEALQAGLEVYSGKALINSTTGESERMEQIFPLAKKYGAAVICLCHDERGPAQDANMRLEVAKNIIARAKDHGVPVEDLVFDPLVLTVGADSNAGRVTLDTVKMLREELKVNVSAGASNVSFGLPDRPALNAAFLSMLMARGLAAAITNPLEPAAKTAILASDLFMGHDSHAGRWLKDFRQREKAKQEGGSTRS